MLRHLLIKDARCWRIARRYRFQTTMVSFVHIESVVRSYASRLSRFDKYLTDIWSIKKKYTLFHRIVIFVQKILTKYCSRDSKI